jgi:hypothetical protein
MQAEKREHWMRLCVEAADEQDLNRLLEQILKSAVRYVKRDAAQKCAARSKKDMSSKPGNRRARKSFDGG